MLTIDPTDNTERENYKLLTGSIIPRPIAFVTSVSETGVINGAPFSYFNIVSSNPPMISLSIQRVGEKQKDTARNLLHNKEFVVHIVDERNVKKINKTAANLPSDQSEVELAKLKQVRSKKVSVPGIDKAKVRLECIVEHHFTLGNQENPSSDFFIGRVILLHVETDLYDNGRIDSDRLGAISRLAGANYAKLGEVFTLERPK